MYDCLFCKIIAGDIPSQMIYEDDATFAFLDIAPIHPGHTLVVPKKHFESVYDVPPKVWSALMGSVHMLSPIVKKGVGADGINIGMNNGTAAGQIIFHTHVHIIPRFNDDGLKHWPKAPYKEGELENVAEKIRKQL